MGNMERRLLVNTTMLATSMHHLASMHHKEDLWKRPRWTVVLIQTLAVVAIIITYFLIAFGSCRRWSSLWIVQKGFFAAQALSLSLGTYLIGLMQSSSVKSEMYPIWTVSLFTLFGCVDPVTSYNGLDYKGQLSKVIYGICLHCGYVVLMSISAVSSVVGNTAIGVLSAITFIKGFHRSLALVQQRRMRNMVEETEDDNYRGQACVLKYNLSTAPESVGEEGLNSLGLPKRKIGSGVRDLVVDFPTDMTNYTDRDYVRLNQVDKLLKEKKVGLQSCYDACAAYCLSHYLQRHFLGLSSDARGPDQNLDVEGVEGYQRALKVIETELAFLYDIFFTGNAFLHYYQAKTTSLWALASFTGICFVGVAAAIPGTIASSTSSGSRFVDTTTADLVITFLILVSLALLQLLQLIRCWTSNWARVAIVCAYARSNDDSDKAPPPRWRAWWMRLKASVATSSNWFDKFLWQQEMGQFSMLSQLTTRGEKVKKRGASGREQEGHPPRPTASSLYWACHRLVMALGFGYIWEVLRDLLGRDTKKGHAFRLDHVVKKYVTDFLSKMGSNRLDGNWKSFPLHDLSLEDYLPFYTCCNPELESVRESGYAACVIAWCVVTGYCEEAEELDKKEGSRGGRAQEEEEREEEHRHVANALCNYCAYLVVSAPELLPGPVKDVRDAYKRLVPESSAVQRYRAHANDLLVRSDRWETLAAVWVRMLVYAAPYGSPEAHMRHLSLGGEFITHLWALLYHLGIREWKFAGNLHTVHSIDHAKTILTEFFPQNKSTVNSRPEDGTAVVAFLENFNFYRGSYAKELADASSLQRDVTFYQTTSRDVANKLFRIYPAVKSPSLVLHKIQAGVESTFLYGEAFRAYAIADFVSTYKVEWTHPEARKAKARLRIKDGIPYGIPM
ncbi:unnamed protein product [Urochloa humidicola]